MVFVFGVDHCRVCFVKPKKSRRIDEILEDEEETPIEMMIKITGTNIPIYAENLELPQKICKSCFLSLDLAYQFHLKVLKAERFIEMQMKKPKNLSNLDIVELEDKQLFPHLNGYDESYIEVEKQFQYEELTNDLKFEVDDAMENAEYLDDTEFDLMVDYDAQDNPNVIEDLENEHANKVVLEESSIVHLKIETEPELLEHKTFEEIQKQEILEPKTLQETQKTDNNIIQVKEEKFANYTTPKNYMCDICGNGFEKRGRMMDHRRRHSRELRFACEICDERFHSREHMRRHMFSHRGERPYKCSYCSRSFYYECLLNSHELVHVGVKPYVCQLCNKAFAYAHALKKHQMIHDKVKLFNCDYCNKEFRLQHHLKQHESTKTHRSAVAQAYESQNYFQSLKS